MSLAPFVPTPDFDEYKERFKDHYKMERRDDGVILVQAHSKGGPIQLSVENHRSLGQMLKTVGADPKNEIMILTGSGDEFMMDADPEGFRLEQEDLAGWAYEYAYKDGRINVSALVNDLEIPTIGVLNGPGFHTEICLMCDLTICAEDAIIYDLHYDIGSVPGDGIHCCFQELLGVKRAAYALLTGQAIDARTALEYGMVNEVVPREKLLERAWQLADHIMTQPRTTRRITTQIVRRPWRQRITNDLDGGFGMQMFAHLAKNKDVHGKAHIRDTVEYVRKGKKNNFEGMWRIAARRIAIASMGYYGGCGAARRGAMCPKNTATGTRSIGASDDGAPRASGRPWRSRWPRRWRKAATTISTPLRSAPMSRRRAERGNSSTSSWPLAGRVHL